MPPSVEELEAAESYIVCTEHSDGMEVIVQPHRGGEIKGVSLTADSVILGREELPVDRGTTILGLDEAREVRDALDQAIEVFDQHP